MIEEVSTQQYEGVIEEVSDLHGNMSVLSKLDTVLRDYNSSLFDVERLLQSDGVLSATIVRFSNSALFSPMERNDSIESALQQVGFDETLKLVSLALSKQVFMRDLDAYGISADSYWRYSYFTAILMEKQAPICGLKANTAYLIGLLHSIGRVVVNELLHSREIEIYWDRYVSPHQWETATIGFTSEIAGSLLLKSWDFSEKVYETVAKQSEPEASESDDSLLLLNFARQIAIQLEDDDNIGTLSSDHSLPYRQKFKQSDTDLLLDIASTATQVEEVFNSLRHCS